MPAGLPGGEKWLENARADSGFHADPIIFAVDDQGFLAIQCHRQLQAGVAPADWKGMAQGVADQVIGQVFVKFADAIDFNLGRAVDLDRNAGRFKA